MKPLLKTIVLCTLLLTIYSCENTTEPVKTEEVVPYMSLHVGDIRQYYEETSGVRFQWSVIDTVYRTDGQKVYAVKESWLFESGLYTVILYYYIHDGYFIQTDLESNAKQSGETGLAKTNNFNEQKLAPVYPKAGMYCFDEKELNDSLKIFLRVRFVNSFATDIALFNTVAELNIVRKDNTTRNYIYYAPHWGHIGSVADNQNNKAQMLANYIKVNNEEIGNHLPFASKLHFKSDQSSDILKKNTLFEKFIHLNGIER
ncbi:MAG: hypothetical protein FD143_3056 [Ignavibacteria bacterium]|nr:MAG: hypothetical protein FD143_3056 [Ignavibacteria bacterium]KAF0154788.1 MAG: hypothetical protein FD188_3225 [Ignavibacteria bacterium]